jgi:hypothetical protein
VVRRAHAQEQLLLLHRPVGLAGYQQQRRASAMSEELNKFVIVQAVSSKSVHGCFVEHVEVYGLFDNFSEAYEYARKNKLGVTGADFMIRNILDKDYWEV